MVQAHVSTCQVSSSQRIARPARCKPSGCGSSMHLHAHAAPLSPAPPGARPHPALHIPRRVRLLPRGPAAPGAAAHHLRAGVRLRQAARCCPARLDAPCEGPLARTGCAPAARRLARLAPSSPAAAACGRPPPQVLAPCALVNINASIMDMYLEVGARLPQRAWLPPWRRPCFSRLANRAARKQAARVPLGRHRRCVPALTRGPLCCPCCRSTCCPRLRPPATTTTTAPPP